jgi:Ubiquinone biosynthesis protein COQ7
MDAFDPQDPAVSSTLTSKQRTILDSALRVDHAGEVAANWIYKGQMFVLGRDPPTRHLIQVCLIASLIMLGILRVYVGNVGSGEKAPCGYG